MAYVSRRSALTIIAGALPPWLREGRGLKTSRGGDLSVAVPVYQTQFIADRIGYFQGAASTAKLVQGGSGSNARDHRLVAGRYRHRRYPPPMQLSNHGRAGRVLMPAIPVPAR